MNLGADYVSELGSGGAWADQRLTKSEIAADPEAAALATYFRQVRTKWILFAWGEHMQRQQRGNAYALHVQLLRTLLVELGVFLVVVPICA